MKNARVSGFRADRLLAKRQALGYTQEQLGERAGIQGDLIGRYERAISGPSAALLVRLAAALEVPAVWLAPLPRRPTLMDHRQRLGYAHRQLTDTLGVSSAHVSDVERGLTWPTNIDAWLALYELDRKRFETAWRNGQRAFVATQSPRDND